ncbi:MAG: glycosyltransferase family 39 protein, partial [Bauldia sp.]|nr:glycosyltransferase family 39 protein [Bauldia sp.]
MARSDQPPTFATRAETFVAALAGSPWASMAAILVVALACFLPGFTTLPPIDGDEPAYVVAAREMVATGDYAAVRLQTDDAEWSPRGAYWIQAFTATLAGGEPPIWFYRLPSLAAAIAAALLTWWTALAFGRPVAALLAGLFVSASGVVGLEARLATPDAILLAATMLAAGALARVWLTRDGPTDDLVAALFWIGLGMGILAKGIVAPAIAAAAILILSLDRGSFHWLRALRPAAGLAGLFLIVSPWLIAVTLSILQGPGGGPSAEFLARIGVPFSFDAPPGTYTLLVPLFAGPAVTFFFLALRWIVVDVRRPVVLFSLALGGPLWVAAELVTAKMAQNILPAVPAIAILAGAAIDAGTARITGKISWFYSLGPLLWPPTIAVVIPAAFFFLEGTFPWFAFISFAAASVLGPVAWIWLRREKTQAAALMSVCTVVFIYLGFFGAIAPAFTSLRVGERVAAMPLSCAEPVFAVAGYPEESMVFVLGRGTRIVDGWRAADFLNSAGCRVAAVDTSVISSFRQRADDLGLGVRDQGRVAGFNLRKMRHVDIHLFVAEGLAR